MSSRGEANGNQRRVYEAVLAGCETIDDVEAQFNFTMRRRLISAHLWNLAQMGRIVEAGTFQSGLPGSRPSTRFKPGAAAKDPEEFKRAELDRAARLEKAKQAVEFWRRDRPMLLALRAEITDALRQLREETNLSSSVPA